MNKNKDCRVGQLTNAEWAAHFHDMIKIIKKKVSFKFTLVQCAADSAHLEEMREAPQTKSLKALINCRHISVWLSQFAFEGKSKVDLQRPRLEI